MQVNESGTQSSYGPQVRRPLRVRVLQGMSLLLAFAGLILLYLYSVNRDIPSVRAGELSPTMNFATVRMSGGVTRDAYLFKSGGVVFDVDDGSGIITVMGGRAQAAALKAENCLPRRGDRVEAVGRLSIRAGEETVLRLYSTDQLRLSRRPAVVTAAPRFRLADITAEQKGERVSVTGALKEISVPRPGSKAPYILTLEEEGAELAVVFWDTVVKELDGNLPMPGKHVSARGQVEVYKETVQLKVREAEDLRGVRAGE
jgi:RecJ-like exonuclease